MSRPDQFPGEMFEADGWVCVETPLVKFTFKPEPMSPFTRYEVYAEYRSSVALLDKIARPAISNLEIRTVALLLHEQLIYAKVWKQSRGLLRNSRSAPVEELRKLKQIASTAPWHEYFDAFRKSSFFTKNLLTEICGDLIYPYSAATSQETLISAVDQALADPRIRARHRDLEMDRCASVLISAFERFTGKEARLSNDRITGRPVSALHDFVRHFSSLYGVWIVTDASDGRLDKMLKNRAEFSGDLLALAWEGTKNEGYAVYTYYPHLFGM